MRSLVHAFVRLFENVFVGSYIRSFVHWFIHSFVCLLILWFIQLKYIRWFVPKFVVGSYICSLIYTFIGSYIAPFVRWFTGSCKFVRMSFVHVHSFVFVLLHALVCFNILSLVHTSVRS